MYKYLSQFSVGSVFILETLLLLIASLLVEQHFESIDLELYKAYSESDIFIISTITNIFFVPLALLIRISMTYVVLVVLIYTTVEKKHIEMISSGSIFRISTFSLLVIVIGELAFTFVIKTYSTIPNLSFLNEIYPLSVSNFLDNSSYVVSGVLKDINAFFFI